MRNLCISVGGTALILALLASLVIVVPPSVKANENTPTLVGNVPIIEDLRLVVLYENGAHVDNVRWDEIVWADVDFVGIRSTYGVGGFKKRYGEVVWYPTLGGITYDRPLWFVYEKLWAKVGGTWYREYLNKATINSVYFDNNTENWRIGWKGTLTAAGKDIPVELGIEADKHSLHWRLKTKATAPIAFENSGIEYQLYLNPYWKDIVEKNIERARVYYENGEFEDYDIGKVMDVTARIPDMVCNFSFLTKDNVEVNLFDFEDVFTIGIEKLAKIELVSLPSGENTYVVRVGASFKGLETGENFVIDPSIVNTSTTYQAVSYSYQHKTLEAAGLRWVFYSDGNNIVYRTSSDGVNWSSSSVVRAGGYGYYFDVVYDGAYLHYAYGSSSVSSIYYRRGTPLENGSITWSATGQALTETGLYPSIAVDTCGYPWIGYRYSSAGSYWAYVTKSSDNDGTWTTASGFPYQLSTVASSDSTWKSCIVQLTENKMYAAYARNAFAGYGKLWDGDSWGGEENVMSDMEYCMSYSVVAQGDDVFVVFNHDTQANGIRFNKRTYGVGWGTENTIQANTLADTSPALTVDSSTGNLYCFWYDSPTENRIYYKKYTASTTTWDTDPTEFYNETDGFYGTLGYLFSTYYKVQNSRVGIVWTSKTSSPYNVKYDNLSIGAPPAFPGKPILLSPENNLSTSDNTPTFTWTRGSNADNHRIEVDNDNDFSSPIDNVVVAAPDDNTWTKTSPGYALGTYYWRVWARNAQGENCSENTWQFTIVPPLPGKPVLVSPENNTQTSDNTPTFTWTRGSNADNHRIEVDNDSDFSSPIDNVVVSSPTDNTWTKTDSGYALGTYYWRVWARNTQGENVSENTWQFTIVSPSPGKPILVSPENNTSTSDNTPTFTWQVGSNADNHRIEVDNDSDFSSPIDNVMLGATDNTWTKPEPGYELGTYYWRVWAINTQGENCSENTWRFTVQALTIVDITLSGVPIAWGTVAPGTENNPAIDNTCGFPMKITVESTTNTNVDIYLKGTNWESGANIIGVENCWIDDDNNLLKGMMARENYLVDNIAIDAPWGVSWSSNDSKLIAAVGWDSNTIAVFSYDNITKTLIRENYLVDSTAIDDPLGVSWSPHDPKLIAVIGNWSDTIAVFSYDNITKTLIRENYLVDSTAIDDSQDVSWSPHDPKLIAAVNYYDRISIFSYDNTTKALIRENSLADATAIDYAIAVSWSPHDPKLIAATGYDSDTLAVFSYDNITKALIRENYIEDSAGGLYGPSRIFWSPHDPKLIAATGYFGDSIAIYSYVGEEGVNGVTLKSSYPGTANTGFFEDVAPSTVKSVYFWISVPSSQATGYYTSTISVRAVRDGDVP